ncbi:MAG: oligosaccharide flippase family protein [Roseburia sp.]|nr:oligosaccharide flippase family protein [Roseburia sp.]
MKSKEGKQKEVVKASFWYLISNVILKGINFWTVPIFARILTQSEYGYFNNFATWLSIITIVATINLSTSLPRARFDFEDDFGNFISSNLLLGSFSVVCFFLVFLLNKSWLLNIFSLDIKYIYIIFGSLFFLPAFTMFQQVQRFAYKYKMVILLTVLTTIGNVIFSFLLIYLMDNNLDARIYGAQLPTFLVSLGLYGYYLLRFHRFRFSYCKYALAIAVPYVAHMLANTVLSSIDRTMITSICGAEDNALYSMAYNIALILTILYDSMNSAYAPWLGEQLHAKNYLEIKQYSYGYILCYGIIVLGVMLIAPELLWILGGEAYIPAKYVIPPVLLGVFFLFLYSMYVNIEQYEKKTKGMAIATIIAATLNLVLNYLFIPRYGYVAAAYTTLVGYIFLFVFHYILVKKMGFSMVYDSQYIVKISMIMCILTLITTFLYESMVLRFIFAGIYIFVLLYIGIKNKKNIIKFIKKSDD